MLTACGRTSLFERAVAPPPAPVCGDGFAEGDERCDDGNTEEQDACRASCVPARCGDGVVFQGVELCDDGNGVSGDGCEADCAPPPCGNARIDPGEQCDDANTDDGDACLSTCVLAFCGDARLRRGAEECDDGNRLPTDACIDCREARCGDGLTWRGVEECDDGNAADADSCSNDCRSPRCGDGRIGGAESCDLGAGNRDQPSIQIEQDGHPSFAVAPLIDARTVETLYDYRSASSHIGFESAGESRVLLVQSRASSGLSLILNHGIDSGLGEPQPNAQVRFEITGLPIGWRIAVVDDRTQELSMRDARSARGRWGFEDNTDGGAISDLPFPAEWTITIEPGPWEGIDRWVVFDGSLGVRRSLDLDRPLRIHARAASSPCRTDCTIPLCGDGRLDGGEVCDDHNTRSGDGCSGDCLRLEP